MRGAVENSKSNVILPVDGVGDDSGSLREIGTQTAGVIHVVMGIDDVFDWLIRREARNFIHHRQRALFSFDIRRTLSVQLAQRNTRLDQS